MTDREKFIAIGRITRAHGIKGAVNICTYGDDASFSKYSHLFLKTPESGFMRYDIAWSRLKKPGHFVVQFKALHDRNGAEGLSWAEVFLDSASLSEPGPDETYWYHLIGMEVKLRNGRSLGHIRNIMDTAGHDVYVVRTGDGREVLIPAVKEIVTDVDVKRGICTIDPPPGLLEANDN